jgi:hypothetical protein
LLNAATAAAAPAAGAIAEAALTLPPWADAELDLSAAANKSPALTPLLVLGFLLWLLLAVAAGAMSQSPEKLHPDSSPMSVSWLAPPEAAEDEDEDELVVVMGKKFCSRAGAPNREDSAPVLLPRRSNPARPPREGTTDCRDEPSEEAADATASLATPASEPNPRPPIGAALDACPEAEACLQKESMRPRKRENNASNQGRRSEGEREREKERIKRTRE